jgi:Matrixin
VASGDCKRRLLRIALVLVTSVLAAVVSGPGAASFAKQTAPDKRIGLRPGQQLAAMRTAIAAAPGFWDGYQSDCSRTVPVLTYVKGDTMGGNLRDQSSGCYVWLNLAQSPFLTAQDICKVTLHEMGHLGGYQHSADPADVMYAPFEADPTPPPCSSPL